MQFLRLEKASFFTEASVFTGAIVTSAVLMTVTVSAARTYGRADDTNFDVIKKALASLMTQKHFRSVSQATDDSGKTTENVVEAIPPKSWHIKNGPMEAILLPDAGFQYGNGHWTRLPADTSKSLNEIMRKTTSQPLVSATVKSLGPADWKGAACVHYSVTNIVSAEIIPGSTNEPGSTSSSETWIRASDGLLLHSEQTGNSPRHVVGKMTFGGKTKMVTDYDYSTPVTITAPKTN